MRKKATSIRFHPSLFEWIKEKAAQEDRSFNYVAERLIESGAKAEGFKVTPSKSTTAPKSATNNSVSPAPIKEPETSKRTPIDIDVAQWIESNIAVDMSADPVFSSEIWERYSAAGGGIILNTFSKHLKNALPDECMVIIKKKAAYKIIFK